MSLMYDREKTDSVIMSINNANKQNFSLAKQSIEALKFPNDFPGGMSNKDKLLSYINLIKGHSSKIVAELNEKIDRFNYAEFSTLSQTSNSLPPVLSESFNKPNSNQVNDVNILDLNDSKISDELINTNFGDGKAEIINEENILALKILNNEHGETKTNFTYNGLEPNKKYKISVDIKLNSLSLINGNLGAYIEDETTGSKSKSIGVGDIGNGWNTVDIIATSDEFGNLTISHKLGNYFEGAAKGEALFSNLKCELSDLEKNVMPLKYKFEELNNLINNSTGDVSELIKQRNMLMVEFYNKLSSDVFWLSGSVGTKINFIIKEIQGLFPMIGNMTVSDSNNSIFTEEEMANYNNVIFNALNDIPIEALKLLFGEYNVQIILIEDWNQYSGGLGADGLFGTNEYNPQIMLTYKTGENIPGSLGGLFHELGHAFDYIMDKKNGNGTHGNADRWIELNRLEGAAFAWITQTNNGSDSNFISGLSGEYFAEMFRRFIMMPERLEYYCPETYKEMYRLIYNKEYVGNSKTPEFDLFDSEKVRLFNKDEAADLKSLLYLEGKNLSDVLNKDKVSIDQNHFEKLDLYTSASEFLKKDADAYYAVNFALSTLRGEGLKDSDLTDLNKNKLKTDLAQVESYYKNEYLFAYDAIDLYQNDILNNTSKLKDNCPNLYQKIKELVPITRVTPSPSRVGGIPSPANTPSPKMKIDDSDYLRNSTLNLDNNSVKTRIETIDFNSADGNITVKSIDNKSVVNIVNKDFGETRTDYAYTNLEPNKEYIFTVDVKVDSMELSEGNLGAYIEDLSTGLKSVSIGPSYVGKGWVQTSLITKSNGLGEAVISYKVGNYFEGLAKGEANFANLNFNLMN